MILFWKLKLFSNECLWVASIVLVNYSVMLLNLKTQIKNVPICIWFFFKNVKLVDFLHIAETYFTRNRKQVHQILKFCFDFFVYYFIINHAICFLAGLVLHFVMTGPFISSWKVRSWFRPYDGHSRKFSLMDICLSGYHIVYNSKKKK